MVIIAISQFHTDFDDGQPVGFWETLFSNPKSHPVNYFWADSREAEYQLKATESDTDSEAASVAQTAQQAQLQHG